MLLLILSGLSELIHFYSLWNIKYYILRNTLIFNEVKYPRGGINISSLQFNFNVRRIEIWKQPLTFFETF